MVASSVWLDVSKHQWAEASPIWDCGELGSNECRQGEGQIKVFQLRPASSLTCHPCVRHRSNPVTSPSFESLHNLVSLVALHQASYIDIIGGKGTGLVTVLNIDTANLLLGS
jgi:hypothetical protein